MQPLHLFIYGSLMRGEDNHGWLGDATWLQDVQTAPGYSLHWTNLGPYPGLLDHGSTAVRGELYAVSAARRAILDDFEDHPSLYMRRPVALAGPAGLAGGTSVEAYFLVNPAHVGKPIPSGDWRQRANP